MSAVAHIKQYKAGRFYSDEFRGEISWNGYENNVLLRNQGSDADGGIAFADCGMALGVDDQRDARGMAAWDFDHDGDLDIVVNNNPGDSGIVERARVTLLRNDVGNRRHWLQVELVGTSSNRDAIGALVTVETEAGAQVRHAHAGEAYASQGSSRLHFGLGDVDLADRVEVRWPDGEVESFAGIAAGQLIRITQGEGIEEDAFPAPREETGP